MGKIEKNFGAGIWSPGKEIATRRWEGEGCPQEDRIQYKYALQNLNTYVLLMLSPCYKLMAWYRIGYHLYNLCHSFCNQGIKKKPAY
ncbi:MAG: hypothetical protein K6G10_00975 [Butyrivibrio sp.]|nr:hypothetical protein [Butyrivibrio sp.]